MEHPTLRRDPKFQHDSTCCKFLGGLNEHDIYICIGAKPLGPTILARFGNEPPEYASSAHSVLKSVMAAPATRHSEDFAMVIRGFKLAEALGYF